MSFYQLIHRQYASILLGNLPSIYQNWHHSQRPYRLTAAFCFGQRHYLLICQKSLLSRDFALQFFRHDKWIACLTSSEQCRQGIASVEARFLRRWFPLLKRGSPSHFRSPQWCLFEMRLVAVTFHLALKPLLLVSGTFQPFVAYFEWSKSAIGCLSTSRCHSFSPYCSLAHQRIFWSFSLYHD